MQTTLNVDCKRHLFYSSFVDTQDAWPNEHFIKALQIPGELGDKMRHAFQEVLKVSAPCLIIGSDCGELSADILNQAFAALQDNDVVVGPTFDGGYYLLGLRDSSLDLFSDIAWSTEQVYAQTIEKVKQAGATYFDLPRLHDIDYEEDYLAWKAGSDAAG